MGWRMTLGLLKEQECRTPGDRVAWWEGNTSGVCVHYGTDENPGPVIGDIYNEQTTPEDWQAEAELYATLRNTAIPALEAAQEECDRLRWELSGLCGWLKSASESNPTALNIAFNKFELIQLRERLEAALSTEETVKP